MLPRLTDLHPNGTILSLPILTKELPMITLLVVGLLVLAGVGSWGYMYGGWRGYLPGGILGALALALFVGELVLLWGD